MAPPVASSTPATNISRPVPEFFNHGNRLSTKKERCTTPKRKIPPRPPSKSFNQNSRLFFSFNNSQQIKKAQIITSKSKNSPKLSPNYDHDSKETYLKQCFSIEERIGSGSFSDVFRVKSTYDNKYYAVKVSREKFKGKADREEKINEVFRHEQLPYHYNLVKFYCAWEEKQRLYIQTELCAGTLSTLAENNHNIPELIIWLYLVDLLKAIDHLHSNNLIHLDIKPENIFISTDGICKLGDFGLIYDINNKNLKEATEGDPKYLAGEVMQGIFTKSADIFSLGMTILEISFDLDLPNGGHLWHMLRKGDIPEDLFETRSNELKTIIKLMLNPDYNKRPTANDLLNHPIIAKYKSKRFYEIEQKKLLTFFRNQFESIDYLMTGSNVGFYIWFGLKQFTQIITLPIRFIWNYFYYDEDILIFYNKRIKNGTSNKYDRTYVSNYLDEDSDEEMLDSRQMSNLDLTFSSDDEMFAEKLSFRNLCSTVNCNRKAASIRFASPKLSPLEYENENDRSTVIQRLKFDEFSSDEMEISENEGSDDNGNNMTTSHCQSYTDSSSIFDDSPKFSRRNFHNERTTTSNGNISFYIKNKNNIPRKNLMKTFDEMEKIKT